MVDVAVHGEGEIARPLKVLEQLIKNKIVQAEAAAEDARQPFYREIGPLLVEAKDGHFRDNISGFYTWAKRFGKSQETIRRYTALGAEGRVKPFKHLEEFIHTPKHRGGMGHTPRVAPLRRDWAEPVDAVAQRAREEARRLSAEDALTRQQEREAEAKLGLRLIDIGYKVLARELHPDKGGSRQAMARLNKVRERLKANV